LYRLTAGIHKVIMGVAVAAVLGGGGQIVSNTVTNAQQDDKNTQQDRRIEQLSELGKTMNKTTKSIAVLNERIAGLLREMDREREGRNAQKSN